MTLTFDPFREVDRLAQHVFGTAATARGPRWMPMDLYRVEDHFVIAVDLPGVDPGSIDVGVDGNTLTIRAERSVRSEEHAQWLAQERPAGTFMRQLNLGDGLDVDRIEASYDAGVLTVTIPVAERARPRKITVEAGRSSRTGDRRAPDRPGRRGHQHELRPRPAPCPNPASPLLIMQSPLIMQFRVDHATGATTQSDRGLDRMEARLTDRTLQGAEAGASVDLAAITQ